MLLLLCSLVPEGRTQDIGQTSCILSRARVSSVWAIAAHFHLDTKKGRRTKSSKKESTQGKRQEEQRRQRQDHQFPFRVGHIQDQLTMT